MTVHHWFIPHRHTHKKAKLITWQALLIYLLLFVIMQGSFSLIGYAKPGVLGTTSSISKDQIIALTNQQRAENGLPPLAENTELDLAAAAKAANMFEENYWAHFAPSGKDPWGFILAAGYKFSVAGENLAKNFTNSDDVVVAWMNSPSHRENIVNSKYREIGIAVEDGVLQGQQTTLVVQMFGTSPDSALAQAPAPVAVQAVAETSPSPTPAPAEPVVNVSGQEVKISPTEYEEKQTQRLIAQAPKTAGVSSEPLFDPFVVSKVVGLSLVGLIALLLILDLIVLRSRGVYRQSSHHLAHLCLLAVAALALLLLAQGNIL